jgi:hypothetical protein
LENHSFNHAEIIILNLQIISEPTVIPKDFRLDRTKQVEAHKAHFIWEAVDTSEDKIHGEFRGYKVRYFMYQTDPNILFIVLFVTT